MRVIAQRELRNDIGRVLREVEAGERLRITVDGRPVADLVPIEGTPRTFVPRMEVTRLLGQVPLDGAFMRDIDVASGDSTARTRTSNRSLRWRLFSSKTPASRGRDSGRPS
jgi:prevent-host-death family protein